MKLLLDLSIEFHDFVNSWSPVDIGRLLFYGYVVTFIGLMLTATVGRRLGIRKKYIKALDKLFQFAAVKLDSSDEEDFDENRSEDKGVVICPESPKVELDNEGHAGEYKLHQTMPYMSAAMSAIVSDCVSKSFTSEELRTWNMLSRTRRKEYLSQSKSLTLFWLVGCFIRYVFFMPVRVLILIISLSTLVVLTTLVGMLPTSNFKKRLNRWAVMAGFEFIAGSISVTTWFHDKYNRPAYGIAVSNHTSPIDFLVLATDNCYDTVGQKTKGLLGIFLSALSKSSHHIWFDRATAKDRSAAAARMEEHGRDQTLPPLLVFPEGCCVNNTAVMQFKKRAFELDCVVYPIAIRFDPRYGDPFWWQDSFAKYCFHMMTSWAIVCNVWYLPPMKRHPHEGVITFANRVRSAIAHKGGFVELAWDGFIKVKTSSEAWKMKESNWKKMQQTEFARHLSLESEEEEGENGSWGSVKEDAREATEEEDRGRTDQTINQEYEIKTTQDIKLPQDLDDIKVLEIKKSTINIIENNKNTLDKENIINDSIPAISNSCDKNLDININTTSDKEKSNDILKEVTNENNASTSL